MPGCPGLDSLLWRRGCSIERVASIAGAPLKSVSISISIERLVIVQVQRTRRLRFDRIFIAISSLFRGCNKQPRGMCMSLSLRSHLQGDYRPFTDADTQKYPSRKVRYFFI